MTSQSFITGWVALPLLCLGPLGNAQDQPMESDFQLELQLEDRWFFEDAAYVGQRNNFVSVAVRPDLEFRWKEGDHRIKATFFGRWDQHDANRTHADIRELYYQRVLGNKEISVGIKKVFWGVTESAHLVDIINQTDQVESFDGEQKLGQPMAHFSHSTSVGTFDVFYLPYARKRQFPAGEGRLRFPIILEREDLEVDSDMEQWHPSAAFRWGHYAGPLDVGVSYFYGVGREPLIENLTSQTLSFFYPIIHQLGLELQATTGPVLWKLESIYRYAEQQDFTALVAGFEYTFWNIASRGIDVGVLGEYLYDGRNELAFTALQNDVFYGSRLAFNDAQSTAILVGGITDLSSGSTILSAEASRRLGSSWTADLEARLFSEVAEEELILANFQQDSFLRIVIAKYF